MKKLAFTLVRKFDPKERTQSRRKSAVRRRMLARTPGKQKTIRAGVLDMGAWIGGLPMLLEKLNRAQTLFEIFEVQAPMPGGLLKTTLGMANWVEVQLGRRLSARDREDLEPHVVADDFFHAGEDVRRHMGLDIVVGLTPAMVAGTAPNDTVYWNHFSSVSGKTILLSTTDLRKFSEDAGRPFEAGVGVLLVAALLIAVNRKVEYHEDAGCIFDYNESRVSLTKTLRQVRIEDSCLALMTQVQRKAAQAMIGVLSRMRRRSS